MAVIAQVLIADFSREQYDRLREEVGWLHEPPIGGISHVAWWEGNDCHGFDVWESEAAWSVFGQDRMGPAMAKLGYTSQPQAAFFPAHEAFAPEAITLLA